MILLLETSGKFCSAGLLNSKNVSASLVSGDISYGNSEQLITLTRQLLDKENTELKELEAVAISSGPGSYTGLRIGTSFAKGICFAAGIPLISVNTLEALYRFAKRNHPQYDCYIANLDAIKNEIYCSVFEDSSIEIINTPLLLDEHTFDSLRIKRCCVAGNANSKIKNCVSGIADFHFIDVEPHADYLREIAIEKFNAGIFESTALFEPNYIKQFVAGVSKKFNV